MIARAGSGWQTLLADLSIILFMVTAATLSQSREGGAKEGGANATPTASPRGEPLAVYRAGAGAPPLSHWLTSQSPDSRQQLSIVAHYGQGKQQVALTEASALLAEAGHAGLAARLVVEPGEGGTVATLAYDAASAGLAQGLLQGPALQVALETRP